MNQFFFKLFDELKYATWFLFTTEPSFPFDTTQNLILHDLPVKSFTLESLNKKRFLTRQKAFLPQLKLYSPYIKMGTIVNFKRI